MKHALIALVATAFTFAAAPSFAAGTHHKHSAKAHKTHKAHKMVHKTAHKHVVKSKARAV